MNLTQEELKSFLYYDPLTGLFTRIKHFHSTIVGDVAGTTCRSSGYVRIKIKGKLYRAHRLAFLYMTGSFPSEDVDHHDHIRDNNKWLNLRLASNTINNKNSSLRKDNRSGCTGVYWHKVRKRWMSQININGVGIHLGSFEQWWDAVCTSKSAHFINNFSTTHGVALNKGYSL